MPRDYAALCFTEDENLKDRLYWYACEEPLEIGERVLAPVGVHDRLQAARVEKTLRSDEPPYDPAFLKRVAAKFGARKLVLGEREYLEFGGARYDAKHYTRFGKLLYCREETEEIGACAEYGVTLLLQKEETIAAFLKEFSRERGCALVSGERGKKVFSLLLSLVRGEIFSLPSADRETLALLKEKLQ